MAEASPHGPGHRLLSRKVRTQYVQLGGRFLDKADHAMATAHPTDSNTDP